MRGWISSLCGETKNLEEKIQKLEKELRESDDSNYKRSKELVGLAEKLNKIKEERDRLQDKVNVLEEELSVLRGIRKEIDEKTKDGVDKDAVIVQLILEKDRLAVENLKYHNQIIEKDRIAIETARLGMQRFIQYFPAGGITYI